MTSLDMGVMVALQSLKNTNAAFAKVQNEVSTQKSVATAKDNAALWAISKVMESDVKGFKAVSDNLGLASATLSMARTAADTVTELLVEMKGKIISAQEENVDRAKIQTDIDGLREQIRVAVEGAQFSGLNMVDNSDDVDFLSSLNRSATGVDVAKITVSGQDLSIGGYEAKDVFSTSGSAVVSTDADTLVMSLDAAGGSDEFTIEETPAGGWEVGDNVSLTVGGHTVSYTVRASDVDSGDNTVADLISIGLKNAVDKLGIDRLVVDYDSASPGTLTFTNDGDNDLTVSGQFRNAGSGGLAVLSTIDVVNDPEAAMANIEGMMQIAIDAAAAFGSAEKRVGIQSEFVKSLGNALDAGIQTLVGADMEEASARLQALQVQQQLGIQALSIANQQPQNLLALFR